MGESIVISSPSVRTYDRVKREIPLTLSIPLSFKLLTFGPSLSLCGVSSNLLCEKRRTKRKTKRWERKQTENVQYG